MSVVLTFEKFHQWCAITGCSHRMRTSAHPTHCSILQHTATHCNTLQYTEAHYNTLQYIATHCSTLQLRIELTFEKWCRWRTTIACSHHIRTSAHPTHCSILQHPATHCNMLQYTETHCNTLQHTAIHCSTLQYTATKNRADF